jgi:gluconate kinase
MFYLKISLEQAQLRVSNRHQSTDHYFHPTLVTHQFDALQIPAEDEHVITIEGEQEFKKIIDDISQNINDPIIN